MSFITSHNVKKQDGVHGHRKDFLRTKFDRKRATKNVKRRVGHSSRHFSSHVADVDGYGGGGLRRDASALLIGEGGAEDI